MAVNVFGMIIPNQKKIAAALLAGRAARPARSARIGKQRSVHNNYLTLPVLVLMVSGHYPMLSSHPQSWLVVALIIVIGGAVAAFPQPPRRRRPARRSAGRCRSRRSALAAALYADRAAQRRIDFAGLEVSDGEVLRIVGKHCVMCHSPRPSHEGFDAPPKGVVLGSLDDVLRHKDAGPGAGRQRRRHAARQRDRHDRRRARSSLARAC